MRPPPPPALRPSAHPVRLSSRAAYDSEAEGASSEAEQSEGDWVEVEGEEAEAVLMELDGPSAGREPAGDASASDDEEEAVEAEALSMGAHISLADNGFELKVGNRLLGARELARYYKQRPRPCESAAVIVAAGNTRSVTCATRPARLPRSSLSAFRERGIILARGGGRALGKVEVTKAQARAERKAFLTDARLRLKTEMGANGAMFRGYREA